jgi:hypothetical protein
MNSREKARAHRVRMLNVARALARSGQHPIT